VVYFGLWCGLLDGEIRVLGYEYSVTSTATRQRIGA
jgi:hypothetical protein